MSFLNAFSSLNDGVLLLSDALCIEFSNSSAQKFLGYSSSQLLNSSIYSLFVEEEKNRFQLERKTLLSSTELAFVSRDGAKLYFSTSFSPCEDPLLPNLKFSLLFRPENRLVPFFRASLDLLCIASFEGYFLTLNAERWSKELGFTYEELTSKPFVHFVHPDDVASTIEATKQLTRAVEVVTFENRYRHKDGHYVRLEWNASMDVQKRNIYAIARNVEHLREKERLADITENAQRIAEGTTLRSSSLHAWTSHLSSAHWWFVFIHLQSSLRH